MKKSNTLWWLVLGLAMAGLLCSGCSQMKKSRHLSRAEKYFAAGDYEKATIEYENVLRLDFGTNRVAWLRLARIACEQGVPSRGLLIMREYGLKPDDPVLALNLAQVQLATNRALATSNLLALAAQSPTNPLPLWTLAKWANTNRPQEIAQTAAQLEAFAQQHGDSPCVQLARAVLLGRQFRFSEEEQVLRRLLQVAPGMAYAHAEMAQLCLNLNPTNQVPADQAMAEACRLAPLRSPIRIGYAAYKAAGWKTNEARSILNEILKKAPDYVPACGLLAQLELRDRRYDAARALTDRALRADPMSVEIRELRSQIYLAQGKPQEAVKEWEQLDHRIPNNPFIKLQLVQACQRASDGPKALSYCAQAVSLCSNRWDAQAVDARLTQASLQILSGKTNKPLVIEALGRLTSLLENTNFLRVPPNQILYAQLLQVDCYRALNQYTNAIAAAQHLARTGTNDPRIPVLLGLLYREQGKLDEARTQLREALALSPSNLIVFSRLVEVELASSNYPAALDLVRAQPAGKTNEMALLKYLEGWVYYAWSAKRGESNRVQFDSSKLAQADSALKRCLEINPENLSAFQLLSRVYYASTNLADSAKEMEQVVAKLRKTTQAEKRTWQLQAMTLAAIYEQMGRTNETRDLYYKQLEVNPDYVPALNNLAYLLAVTYHETDKAYELAQKANRLAPDSPQVADTLGWVLCLRKDYQAALPLLRQAAEKFAEGQYPESPLQQYHLGVASYMLGEAEAAKAALQRAVSAPEDFKEKEDAGKYLKLLSQADSLDIASLEKLVADQDKDVFSRSLLAGKYEQTGQAQKAADQYNFLLKQNPRSAQAALHLATLNDGPLNNPAGALKWARKAHDLAPTSPEAAALLGRLVYKTGDHAQAYGLLQSSAQQLPARADVQYDAAWAAFSVGRVSEADQAMRRALQADPNFKQADAAKWFVTMTAAYLNPTNLPSVQATIEQLLTADPNHGPAMAAKALLLRSRGDTKGAILLFEKLLVSFPKFAPATREIGLLYAPDPAQSQKAYKFLDQAHSADGDDLAVDRALGILIYQQGKDYRYASTLLKSWLRSNPNDAEALFCLGMSQVQSKEPSEKADGTNALKNAVGKGLEGPLLLQAKGVLTPPISKK